jgi:YegS/Rv2252/BmrU family lipid kinase
MSEKGRRRLLFIVNPISGRGKALKSKSTIKRFCKKRRINYSILETEKAGDASNYARKGISSGFDAIVAIGGDGTVNEVGRELIGQNVPLGIIPKGSGNGLARHLGVPMNTKRALRRIYTGKNLHMDTGELDGKAFLNMAGIGFDAHVSKAFSESKSRGWFNYLKIIVRLGKDMKALPLRVTMDNKEEVMELVMLTIANSSQYGNNAKIAPKANISDGKFEVCALKNIGFVRSAVFLIRLFIGGAKENAKFQTYPAGEIKIEGCDGWAHVDGDPVKTSSTVSIEIKPKSLYVIC